MSTVWLITGTSTGFGRELVLECLGRGERVIATARSVDKIQDFPRSDDLFLLQLDLDWETTKIAEAMNQAISVWGHIDVLVNNAGFGFKSIIEEAGSAGFKKQFQTNFFGLIDVTNAVLPGMRARRSGTVVMMGSRSSWRPEGPTTGVYAASKAALRVYSEALASEIQEFFIRVLIVEPAAFRTQSLQYDMNMANPIPDYDSQRNNAVEWFKLIESLLKGDPKKAVEVIIDVVKGEGKAKGKDWPLYLLLGNAALAAVKEKTARILGTAENWKDVTENLDFD